MNELTKTIRIEKLEKIREAANAAGITLPKSEFVYICCIRRRRLDEYKEYFYRKKEKKITEYDKKGVGWELPAYDCYEFLEILKINRLPMLAINDEKEYVWIYNSCMIFKNESISEMMGDILLYLIENQLIK